MKKIALLAAVAACCATTAFAADDVMMKKETTTATTTTTAAAPMEMKAGGWAKADASGKVMVSKDDGKTWAAAPDGTWEMKDGTKVTTKGGMMMK